MNAQDFIKETQWNFDGRCLGLQPTSIYKYMLKFENDFNADSAREQTSLVGRLESFNVILSHQPHQVRFLKYRRMLVDWMFEIGESIPLLPRTCHTAAVMLDLCFIRKPLEKKLWQAVTLACLSLAAKHIEKDERKHYLKMLAEKAKNESKLVLERKDIAEAENIVLEAVDYKIPNFSLRHFLEALLCVGFSRESDQVFSFADDQDKFGICNRLQSTYPNYFYDLNRMEFVDVSQCEEMFDKVQPLNAKTVRYLRKYACFFSDLCVQHIAVVKFKYSLLSACCLAASRKALNLAKIWPSELEQMTGYTFEQLRKPLHEIWRIYESDYKKESLISWRSSHYYRESVDQTQVESQENVELNSDLGEIVTLDLE